MKENEIEVGIDIDGDQQPDIQVKAIGWVSIAVGILLVMGAIFGKLAGLF